MNADRIKLEHEISSFIGTDNGATVHFEYDEYDSFKTSTSKEWTVSAFTVNPKSGETFLLKECKANDELKALKAILNYVKEQKGMSSFTVEWSKVIKGNTTDHKIHTSYFYCHDALDVMEKFFYNKKIDDYIVWSLKLNPIA